MIGVCACLPAVAATSYEFEQRAEYLQAREHLRQGRIGDFRRVAKNLDDYALRPYLDYHYLRSRLGTASSQEVLKFLEAHGDLPAAALLRKRWLRELGKRRQWQLLLRQYEPTNDAELRCYHLRAIYGSGEKERALDDATEMWLQPASQPQACDPLFEVWRSTNRFTENRVWQRFSAALMANQRNLARYLIRYLSGANKTAAEAFYGVHVTPQRITRASQYRTDNEKYRQLIAHGIRRLAGRDADKADQAWRGYKKSHNFDAAIAERVDGVVAVELAEQESRFPDQRERGNFSSADVLEDFTNAAVEAQQWPQVQYWINRLPADIKTKSQWQYWRARAMAKVEPDPTSAASAYAEIANQRHYYGFMSARQLGIPGRMNAQARSATKLDLTRIQRLPGIKRSVELFAVGDDINGRREWYQALNQIGQRDQILAAELAQQLGLVSMAIRTANIAEATDHLHLRFPLVYEPQFRRASLGTALGVPLLISIARQESAMEADARSSADARGLMQLLPSTARLVARRAKQTIPSASDLYDPGTNIKLGSYHLAWLMARYDNQAPLAFAAYNAGEHRVDRWIKQASGMPMDVWIERIPFRETRNYVKNVLAFRHVYGDKLATPAPILASHEQFVRLP